MIFRIPWPQTLRSTSFRFSFAPNVCYQAVSHLPLTSKMAAFFQIVLSQRKMLSCGSWTTGELFQNVSTRYVISNRVTAFSFSLLPDVIEAKLKHEHTDSSLDVSFFYCICLRFVKFVLPVQSFFIRKFGV